MSTIAEKVFNFILDDKLEQQAILKDLPKDKRDAVVGRKGRLTVTGPQGGTFIMRLTPQGIFKETDTKDLRNEMLMTDDILREILVWIAKIPGADGTSPREAYLHGDLKIKGESVLYDGEEIFNAMEKHAFAKMKPIARAAVEGMRKGRQE